MFSVGLRFSLRRILRPLRNIHGSIRALAANFVVVPLLAFGVGILLGLSVPDRIGLFLLGTGAGAAFLMKLAAIAKADIAQTTSLLVLLLVGTIIYMPLILPFAFQNTPADISAVAIARPLIMTMLAPLGLGLIVRNYAPLFAKLFSPIMGQVATVALVVLIASLVALNLPAVFRLVASRAFIAILLLVAGSFFFGWWMAPTQRTEPVFGLGTGQRNVAAAAVVAEQSFTDPEIAVVVVIGAVLGFVFLFPAAFVLKNRVEKREERERTVRLGEAVARDIPAAPYRPPPGGKDYPRPGDRP